MSRATILGHTETGVFNVATGESRTSSSIVKELRDIAPSASTTQSMPRKGALTRR